MGADPCLQASLLAAEEAPHVLPVFMHNGEGPECVVEDILGLEYLNSLLVKKWILAEPVDTAQIESDLG
jgi:hypothetical protein